MHGVDRSQVLGSKEYALLDRPKGDDSGMVHSTLPRDTKISSAGVGHLNDVRICTRFVT